MQYLIDFSERDEEFRRISERASGYPIVQGVVLDLDRAWLRAWQVQERFGSATLSRWADYWDAWHFEGPRHDPGDYGLDSAAQHPTIYSRPLEWKDIERWRPPNSRWRQRLFGLNEDAWPLGSEGLSSSSYRS